MKSKAWPHTATGTIATLCLALSACGGGPDPEPPPPPPAPTKLNADNLLDATGVALLALQRTQEDTSHLVGTAYNFYLQQLAPGKLPCSNAGSLTLSRPSPEISNYSANDCDTGTIKLQSGQFQLDASAPSGQGLKLVLNDITYFMPSPGPVTLQTVKGSYTFLITAHTSDLQKSSLGDMSVTANGRADSYSDIYIATKKSDSKFLQYGVKIKSPRFAHELTAVLDGTAKTVTVQADDGSGITISEVAGGAKLELRKAATDAPLLSKSLSNAELEAALARALK